MTSRGGTFAGLEAPGVSSDPSALGTEKKRKKQPALENTPDRPIADLSDLARVIAAADADPGQVAALAAVLGRMRDFLSKVIVAEDGWPNSAPLRQRLDALRKAARKAAATISAHPAFAVIAQELADPALLHALHGAAEFTREVEALARLSGTCAALAAAATRVHDMVPTGSGQRIFAPNPEGLSPQELCASAVTAAWYRARGTLPRHTAPAVHTCCQALWEAAGGQVRGGWGQGPRGWQERVAAAKTERAAAARARFDEYFQPPA